MSGRVPIIQTVAALDSMKKRGITLMNAIREAVDNSWDWMGESLLLGDARVHVNISMDENDDLTVIIADNAAGIPRWVRKDPKTGEGIPVDSESEADCEGLQMALRVGGRISQPRRGPIGRFGFGLPQSALALCNTTHVHSKTKGGEWRHLELDIEEMRKPENLDPDTMRPMLGEPDIEPDGPAHLPGGWEPAETGTVVVFEDIPKETHRAQYTPGFLRELREELGRTYRYPIQAGLRIVITTDEHTDLEPIPPVDPLCQMERAESSRFGPVDESSMTIVFDGKGGNRPEVIDPVTGLPAEVVVRFVRVDPKRVREEYGIPLNIRNISPVTRYIEDWNFNLANQGFSLMRGDREIGYAEDFGLFGRADFLNYFRGEVRFPPIKELDRLFGIEPDKAKFRLDSRMIQWMQNARATILEIRDQTQKALRRLSPPRPAPRRPRRNPARPRADPRTEFESASKGLKEILPPVETNLTDEQLREARLKLEEGDKEAVRVDFTELIDSARKSVKKARNSEDTVAERDAVDRVSSLEKELAWSLRNLDERFASEAYFRTHERDRFSDRLYWVEWTDQGPRVVLNTRSAFHRNTYARTHEGSRVRAILDLMIWSMAYADENPTNSPEKQEFWGRVRPIIARTTSLMLTVLDNVEDETEPVPKRSKQEVMSSICTICGLADREILKGSSVPKPFLIDLLEHLGGGRNERITKHAAFTKALSLLDPENGATRSEKHLSRAGTVALSGLLALEEAL